MQEAENPVLESSPRIEIGAAFRAPFRDPGWKGTLGLLALVQMVPVVTLAAVGWGMAYQRVVANQGVDATIPDWSGFITMWRRGFGVLVAALLWAVVVLLPAAVLSIAGTLVGAPESMGFVVGVALAAFAVCAVVLLPAMQTSYAMSGDIGDMLGAIRAGKRIARHPSYWTAWGMSLAVGLPFGALSLLAERVPSLAAIGPWELNLAEIALGIVSAVVVVPVTSVLFGQWAAIAFTPEERTGEIVDRQPSSPADAAPPPPPSWEPFETGDHQSGDQERRS